MKIGLVTPGGFDRSGCERVIPVLLWLVERLARRHEVHVYTLYQYPYPDEYPLLGATVHNIGRVGRPLSGLRLILRTIQALAHEHRRSQFDVLHAFWATESGLVAALAGRLLNVGSVVSLIGGELVALPEIGYGSQLQPKRRMVVGFSLRLAKAITATSEFARRPLLKHRPDARYVPLGADTSLFTPPALPPAQPPWRLLHVASLNRVKDQPTLLRAVRRIYDAEPAIRLDVIGEDTLGGAIQSLAHELGLSEVVTFHGAQPNRVVAEFLQNSHLLLLSSRHEAGPAVFSEAASCAVPTVGTAVGHIADRAPGSAVAVPVGDHEALAQATLALLRDEARRKALGKRALEWARAHDADWTAAQFEAIYSEAKGRI